MGDCQKVKILSTSPYCSHPSSKDVIYIGHFTLVDARRAKLVVGKEVDEDSVIPVEVRVEVFVMRIRILTDLAPVLDEAAAPPSSETTS